MVITDNYIIDAHCTMADRSTASVLLRSYFNKKESKESNSKSDPDMTCRLGKKEVAAQHRCQIGNVWRKNLTTFLMSLMRQKIAIHLNGGVAINSNTRPWLLLLGCT